MVFLVISSLPMLKKRRFQIHIGQHICAEQKEIVFN